MPGNNNITACGLAQEEAKFQQALECKRAVARYAEFADHVNRLQALYKTWITGTTHCGPELFDQEEPIEAAKIDLVDAPDNMELQVDIGTWHWFYQILKPGHKDSLAYKTRMVTIHGSVPCHDLRDPTYSQVEDIVEALLTFTRNEKHSQS
jgi:hypothetical protein